MTSSSPPLPPEIYEIRNSKNIHKPYIKKKKYRKNETARRNGPLLSTLAFKRLSSPSKNLPPPRNLINQTSSFTSRKLPIIRSHFHEILIIPIN